MNRKLPFQDLDYQSRINLAIFAALILYLMQIGLALYVNNLFNTLGSDFLGFWTTGFIANTKGYSYIYDPNLVSSIQKPYHEILETDNIYAPILSAFFPAFGLPFQLFALLEPGPAFAIWSFLNFIVLVFYLHFFIKNLTEKRLPSGLLALLIISYPVFHNLFWGQINVWLLICVGEFMRAIRYKRSFLSGLWLAGMLLKPQTLILLIPALMIKRSWVAITGFLTGLFAILLISFLLAGTQGFAGLVNVWSGFATGIPTNAPEDMVNWRMIMVQLNAITGSNAGVVIAILGAGLTLLACLLIWPKSIKVDSRNFAVVLLGLLATTAVTTWHSHIHMMLVLLPPLAYLAVQNRLPSKILLFWNLGPPLTMLLSDSSLLLARIDLLPQFRYEGFYLGLWGLIFNLSLLAWAIKTHNQLPDKAE